MRLLFVHDHRFLRGPDGAIHTVGSFPRSIWERYLKDFDEIVVVARDGGTLPPGSDLARSDHPQVRFVLIASVTLPQRLLGLPGAAHTAISREIAAADALLVRVPSDLGNLAASLTKRSGTPLAVEAVGCALDGYRNHGSPIARAYAPLAMRRMQAVTAAAPQVLYVTREFLQRRYPTRGEAVGVSDVEIVALSTAERHARDTRLRQIGQGRSPVVGTVASLRVMSKGIQVAIAALSRMADEAPEYRVLGAGDAAPWRARAEAAGVSDNVHFDGSRASGQAVREWLDGIDIHIQPSFQEGLPRATVEAMSRGCACLGSTAGGLPELLTADRLHTPGDDEALAVMLWRLVSDPALLIAASERDLAVSAQYLPEAIDPVREGFYARLAERARRR